MVWGKEAKKRNNGLKRFETKYAFASPCTGEGQCEKHQLLREATSSMLPVKRANGKSRGTAVPSTMQLPCMAYCAIPCLTLITILNTTYLVSSVYCVWVHTLELLFTTRIHENWLCVDNHNCASRADPVRYCSALPWPMCTFPCIAVHSRVIAVQCLASAVQVPFNYCTWHK